MYKKGSPVITSSGRSQAAGQEISGRISSGVGALIMKPSDMSGRSELIDWRIACIGIGTGESMRTVETNDADRSLAKGLTLRRSCLLHLRSMAETVMTVALDRYSYAEK